MPWQTHWCLPAPPAPCADVSGRVQKEQTAVPSAQERQQPDAGTASLEARLKANEDWRSQQDARMQLEDKWKAGQEAAFNHWRNENDARVRVEEDWKALHESRMVNVRFSTLLMLTFLGRHRQTCICRCSLFMSEQCCCVNASAAVSR